MSSLSPNTPSVDSAFIVSVHVRPVFRFVGVTTDGTVKIESLPLDRETPWETAISVDTGVHLAQADLRINNQTCSPTGTGSTAEAAFRALAVATARRLFDTPSAETVAMVGRRLQAAIAKAEKVSGPMSHLYAERNAHVEAYRDFISLINRPGESAVTLQAA
jgi:hypothetical protein